MTMDHAELLGISVDSAMIKELNYRLTDAKHYADCISADYPSPVKSANIASAQTDDIIENKISEHYTHPVRSKPPQVVKITHMAISIFGATSRDAYLHIEFIIKGSEVHPLMYDIGLEGSEINESFNKEFADLDLFPRRVLANFFKELSSWFTFTGSKQSINDGLLAKVNAKLDSCPATAVICFTKMEVFAVNIASAFQVEFTSADDGKKLLIMIPAAKLGYQESTDPSEPYSSPDSYDIYDLIDSHFYGYMKDQLSYAVKEELIRIFSSLSRLYAFGSTFSVLVSME